MRVLVQFFFGALLVVLSANAAHAECEQNVFLWDISFGEDIHRSDIFGTPLPVREAYQAACVPGAHQSALFDLAISRIDHQTAMVERTNMKASAKNYYRAQYRDAKAKVEQCRAELASGRLPISMNLANAQPRFNIELEEGSNFSVIRYLDSTIDPRNDRRAVAGNQHYLANDLDLQSLNLCEGRIL